MVYTFKGGVHPHDSKENTAQKAIEKLESTDTYIYPLSQHIGAPCEPMVKVGDEVKIGQKIGDSDAFVSAPIFSSVSGKVTAVEMRPVTNGGEGMCIVIENDGKDEYAETVKPYPKSPEELTGEDLAQIARDAGIVGLGGATFPAHVKIRSAIGKVDTLIVNASECEPYITSDHRVMVEYTRDVLNGIKLVAATLKIKRVFIGIEENKPDAAKALSDAVGNNSKIKVRVLKTKYPQGGEKQLIKVLTGKELPGGKLPADVGCIVFNVETCRAIWNAYYTGMPVIQRIVTVSGSNVKVPKNLAVRVGTPIEKLFEACGGFIKTPYKIVIGGPMMGTAQNSLQVPVTKGVSSVLALDENDDRPDPVNSCIRCGRCVRACPMRLLPSIIGMHALHGNVAECEKQNIMDCIECGCCAYSCPANIPLVHIFRTTKQKIKDGVKK